ncbi:prolycopene isomerase, chloroplastic [Diospyros lotus]|uniref:prolycopene isomerase, chloroplastic n=1 Tax=Diospyros lotus TaxID=55363 RepID=UPI00225A14B5|nr:prolycopene isomerase, chloroplastic [Diospyros lotus]
MKIAVAIRWVDKDKIKLGWISQRYFLSATWPVLNCRNVSFFIVSPLPKQREFASIHQFSIVNSQFLFLPSMALSTVLPNFLQHQSLTLNSICKSRGRKQSNLARNASGIGVSSPPATQTTSIPGKPEADVVVIGSGIGGLCCAGLLSRYQQDVLVLESHDLPGGAAHSFEIKGYKFDSGPSLFSGFQSRGPQANPLAQVLDALGESIPCANYDSWMVYIPEGEFLSRIGPTEFFKDLEKYASLDAVREWKKLLDTILPLSAAAMALPPLSIRSDLGVLSTVAARYVPSLVKSFAQMGPQGALGATKLLRPFSEIIDSLELKDPFIRNWIDLLSFLLAGVKSNGILSAEMIYMFAEWYKPGCTLEYPLLGSGAIVDALVRGIQKFGGRISLRSHVENIVVQNGRAVGVKLRSGQFIRAQKAVVSNASMWDTLNLLPKEVIPKSYQDRIKMTPQCESFMHLHLGFEAKGIREDLGIHHIVVNDWDRGVDADQNVVLISVPSALSPDLAPPGKHILHAYTPGTEPFELWEGLDRRSAEYKELKTKRSEVMWRAVERALGSGFDREKCEVKLVGTPLTHQRFLRRNRGTYGPAIEAGKGNFPGHPTPIPQLYCCGDSTFPGIGVPAVAASGAIVANSLVSVSQHSQLLDAVGI